MLLSPFLTCITAISMAALAADSVPKVMQEGDANELYPIAHLADGLKFTHGAFVCADLSSGRFFTLNRNGDLVASPKLEFPEDAEYHISDFDLFSDGSIVAAALPSPFTDVSPFLAFLSPDGKTKHIVRTGVYFPYHVVVASDGTVWTLGHEIIQGNSKDPTLDPNAGILRQFSRSGSAMASALPQSNFRASREEARIVFGKLFAVRDRLGWYSAVGGESRYVEIPTDTIAQHVFPGLPKSASLRFWDGHIDGVAATVGGDVMVSVEGGGRKGRLVFLFDRTTSQWVPLDVPALGGYPFTPRLLGADGDNLVFEYALSAGFFRLVR
jgi:hypothetical protein